MNHRNFLFPILLAALALSACGKNVNTSGRARIEDRTSLTQALKDAGASVEPADAVQQEFFGPEGRILHVNGADLQVFEYPSAEAMEQDAAKVAPDGGSIGTTMVSWMDAPHFYKSGRVLALYVGSDQAVLDLLQRVLGAQFAGK